MNKTTKDILVHLICLLNEIDILEDKKSKIPRMNNAPGLLSKKEALNTTISILKERIKELKRKLLQCPDEVGID